MKNTIKLIALLVVVVMASVIGFEVSAQAPITLGIKQIPQISFTGDPGKSYQIQYATKVDGSWNDLAVIPANPSGVYSYVDTEAVGQRFYRVSDYLTHIVMVTISPSSPMMSVVQISKTEQTDNVLIGRYDIKAQGISSGKLSNLRIRFHTTRKEISALFADIKLLVNGQTYSADSITGSFDGFVVFKNMVEALSIDNSVTVSIYGKLNQDTDGTLSGATVYTSFPVSGVDGGTYNNPEVLDSNSKAIAVKDAMPSSEDITFTSLGAVLSGLKVTAGSFIVVNNEVVGQGITFNMTVTAGNDTLYVAKDPAVSAGIMVGVNTIYRYSPAEAIPANIAGDTDKYLVIPAGTSRQLVFDGSLSRVPGSGHGLTEVSFFSFNFGKDTSVLNSNWITYGLDKLKFVTTL